MISISTLTAAPLRAAPTRNTSPPVNIEIFLPRALVVADAKNEATNAATYNEEVKLVRS
ncbi:hypothetical protein ACHQM5_030860 [Ranunculus cassubicifolius]